MKTLILSFLLILVSTFIYAENYEGKVIQIKPGTYTISYPNQSININFDYTPSNGFENILVEPDLNEHEKNEIVWLLKEQIDQLPRSIIDKYLDIDIFPLQIKNTYEFGWTLDKQVMVEVSRIKDGMSYKNSVKSSLAHQLAHLFEREPSFGKAALNIKNYLDDLNQENPDPVKKVGNSIFAQGYVSRYANGQLSGDYSSEEEFAELFAFLTCDDNRLDVVEFVNEHPEELLSIKVNRFIDLLSEQVPSLGQYYFFRNDIESHEITLYPKLDGEGLLAAHERKSYESFDLTYKNNVDEMNVKLDHDFFVDNPKNLNDDYQPNNSYQTYSYSDGLQSFSQNDQIQTEANQNEQGKKKHKGTGAIIILTLLIVISAL